MKKSILFMLLPLLLLTGCNKEDDSSDKSTSSHNPEDAITINYYAFGAVNDEKEDIIFTTTSYIGEKISEFPSTPESPDPAYKTFVGWSSLRFVLSEDDIWDFENDVVPGTARPGVPFCLYGIWDA